MSAKPVEELTGNEGGVWHVHTRDSVHVFDLDAGTVERVPGPNAIAYDADAPRRLRSIEMCRVGLRGNWNFISDDCDIEYYFHHSSRVQRIQRADDPL